MANAFWQIADLGEGGMRLPVGPGYLIARNRQDSRIAELIGWGFGFERLEQSETRVPTLAHFIQEGVARRGQWLAEGRITNEEILEPGVVVLHEGNYYALAYGEELPGASYIDVSGRPNLFTRLLAAGFSPLSCGSRAHHDMNHQRGLHLDPAYMKGIRKMASDFLQKPHPLVVRDRYIRLFHAYEAMALIPPERAAAVRKLLSPAAVAAVPRVREVNLRLRGLGFLEFVRSTRELIDAAYRSTQFFGGTAEIGTRYLNAELDDGLPRVLSYTEWALNQYEADPAAVRFREAVWMRARLEIALRYAITSSVPGYFEDLLQRTPLSADHRLYRWYVASGIGQLAAPEDRVPGARPTLLALSLAGELSAQDEARFSEHYILAKSEEDPTTVPSAQSAVAEP